MDNLDPTPPAPRARFGGLGRRAAVVATSSGLLVGGITGGFLIAHAADATTTAATSTPSPSGSSGSGSSSQPAAPAPGTFKPNEDPAHEAGESAQREAQENAGQVPTVP